MKVITLRHGVLGTYTSYGCRCALCSAANNQYQTERRARLRARSRAEILADRKRLRPTGVKRCFMCKQTQPLIAFHGDNAARDGLQSECRSCHSALEHHKRWKKVARWANEDGTFTCVYCPAAAEHVDHFYPRAKGGSNEPENLVPACAPCNLNKSAHDPHHWMTTKGITFRGDVPLVA